MTRFRWGVATDIGRTRSVNQDSAYAAEGFFAVADGMGGHQGGEIASAVAIDTLAAALPVVSTDDVLSAIHAANRAVLDRARDDPSLRGMGTTLCVLALVASDDAGADGDTSGNGVAEEPLLVLANVGDSRVYQFAGGVLEQMTDDHSMVGELVRQGRLSAAEAETHPQRNILTRALGIDHRTEIDAWHVRPMPGDRWLLCSDGLFNEVSERTIADVLAAVADPAVAARHLVQLANEHGGRDNITVVIADVIAGDGHAVPAPLGALQEGELASARRRVANEPTGGADVPTAPTGGAGRSDVSGPTGDDEPREAAARPAPSSAGAVATEPRPMPDRRAGFAGRARAGWRVVAFGVALLAVFVVAVGAWVTLRDDSSGDGPPVPATSTAATSSTSTTSTSTTSSTSSTTAVVVTTTVTTTVPPASTGSTTG